MLKPIKADQALKPVADWKKQQAAASLSKAKWGRKSTLSIYLLKPFLSCSSQPKKPPEAAFDTEQDNVKMQ